MKYIREFTCNIYKIKNTTKTYSRTNIRILQNDVAINTEEGKIAITKAEIKKAVNSSAMENAQMIWKWFYIVL